MESQKGPLTAFDVDEAFREFERTIERLKKQAVELERALLKSAEEEKLRRIRDVLSAL